MNRFRFLGLAMALGLAVVTASSLPARAADKVLIAINSGSVGSTPPFFIARDKGYFAEQGIDVQFVFFNDASTMYAAVASGSVDIGSTGIGAGFYNIATHRDIQFIAAGAYERSGFPGETILTSTAEWNKGLKKPVDLAGKKIGLPGFGGAYHYDLLALARKYGFPMPTSALSPLKSKENAMAALLAGSVDAIVTSSAPANQANNDGTGKIVCIVGYEVPYMSQGIYGNAKSIAQRHDVMVRTMRGLLKGASTYAAAFEQTGPDGKMMFSPDAKELLALLSKEIGQSPEVIAQSLQYIPPNGAFGPNEIATQTANWKPTGLLNDDVDPANIVDLTVWKEATAK